MLIFEKNIIMNKLSIIILLLISFSACTQEKDNSPITLAKEFQYKLNLEYADKDTSPLTKKDFKTFSSLDFYPINKDLIIEATFTRTPNEKPFEMVTTTSRLAKYVKYGIAKFVINGKKLQLNIYQNINLRDKEKYKEHLFLPFTDITNNTATYAAGRYVDLKIPKGDTILIDFNRAYNPYCAYNHKYSCPIPPEENNLDIEIKAGVLKFH